MSTPCVLLPNMITIQRGAHRWDLGTRCSIAHQCLAANTAPESRPRASLPIARQPATGPDAFHILAQIER
ncbi:hypothetical protein VTN77DRAFT_3582 [Rasamsonia byssochlamydoides]|uniref:uncharacterized protein n=1 Tax=Rasamsonia byssochlamydoides TaxID=89139 RepID=UPI00374208D2